jgi:cell division protein FtsB
MTNSSDGAQAQEPGPEQSKVDARIVTDMFGVDAEHPIAERIQTPEFLASQLCETAAHVMTVPDYYREEEHNGVTYRVSIGHEHFPEHSGSLEKNQKQRKPEVAGFRLFQEVASKKDQAYKPILLVMNGNLASPFASILPSTSSITSSDGINVETDTQTLSGYLDIANSIQGDCIDQKQQADVDKERQKENRNRRIRKVGKAIVVGLVTTAVIGGAGVGAKAIVETTRANQEEHQAELVAEEEQQAAEAAAEERAAERAQAVREEKVAEFDAQYDIESETVTAAGTVGLAETSSQFVDVSVPYYGQRDIDEKLADNISEPRRVELKQERDDNCTIVEMPIEQTDNFRLVHDGEDGRAINFVFDAKSDELIVCDNTMPNATGAQPANSVFIQKIPS